MGDPTLTPKEILRQITAQRLKYQNSALFGTPAEVSALLALSGVVSTKLEFPARPPLGLGPKFRIVDGIFTVEGSQYQVPHYGDFINDLRMVANMVANLSVNKFCSQKLVELRNNFIACKAQIESTENLPGVSYKNVAKAEGHRHAAATPSKESVLQMVKTLLRETPTLVIGTVNGDDITISDAFKGRDPDSLTLQDLNCHAIDVRGNFLAFKQLYILFGNEMLRDIFLRWNNVNRGEIFGMLIKQSLRVASDNNQYIEISFPLYGKSSDELFLISEWANRLHLYEFDNLRFVLQISRSYKVPREAKVGPYSHVLHNLFLGFFFAVDEPEKYPAVMKFLDRLTAFDSVDCEECCDTNFLDQNPEGLPTPTAWNIQDSPNIPYCYHLFFLYANLGVLNNFMRTKGRPPIILRPHCGESGNIEHVMAGSLLAHDVIHGVRLMAPEAVGLRYLWYLNQVGLQMSPTSNNCLYLDFEDSPFLDYFHEGQAVSLSTDDPLLLHFSEDCLSEEYENAKINFGLSEVDLCEVSQTSVKKSRFPEPVKDVLLGKNSEDANANPATTGVPSSRNTQRADALERNRRDVLGPENPNE